MDVQDKIKKDTVEMLMLALFQDIYGHELCQEIAKRSDGLFVLLEGSMYPTLYRLVEKKSLENAHSYLLSFGNKGTRAS